MNKTKIPWADWTWNPIVGCSPAGKGCANCYAAAISKRFHLPWGSAHFAPERLDQPVKVRKPGRVFVCSMADIGHETVKPEWREAVYAAMRAAPWHTFIILTKRPAALACDRPPENVWIGVSVCEQDEDGCTWGVLRMRRYREDRVLFVSVEPMLGPVTFARWDVRPDWVIAGPETGPKARPCEDAWIDALAAESPCFFDKRDKFTRRDYPMNVVRRKQKGDIMEIDDIIARHKWESEEAAKSGPVDVEFAARHIRELIGHARYMELKSNEALKLLNSLLKEDEALNMLRELRNYLKERFPNSRDAPGHCHVVDGRWDKDGSECAYCSLWKRINKRLSDTGA